MGVVIGPPRSYRPPWDLSICPDHQSTDFFSVERLVVKRSPRRLLGPRLEGGFTQIQTRKVIASHPGQSALHCSRLSRGVEDKSTRWTGHVPWAPPRICRGAALHTQAGVLLPWGEGPGYPPAPGTDIFP